MGTLDTKRDWGFAGDYVRAMWLMLQQPEPRTTWSPRGRPTPSQEFVERAFAEVGIEDWSRYVRQDPKFYRPAEVDLLIGDATKARTELGWRPEIDFPTLVKMMVAHDLRSEARKAGDHAAVAQLSVGIDRCEAIPTDRTGRSALQGHVGHRLEHRVLRPGGRRRTSGGAGPARTPSPTPARPAAGRSRPGGTGRRSTATCRAGTRRRRAPIRRRQGVALQRDHGLGQRQRHHVQGTAEGQHGQRAAGQLGVVDQLDRPRTEHEAPIVPTTPTPPTTIISRRSPPGTRPARRGPPAG